MLSAGNERSTFLSGGKTDEVKDTESVVAQIDEFIRQRWTSEVREGERGTQAAVAKRYGTSSSHVSNVIDGSKGLSEELRREFARQNGWTYAQLEAAATGRSLEGSASSSVDSDDQIEIINREGAAIQAHPDDIKNAQLYRARNGWPRDLSQERARWLINEMRRLRNDDETRQMAAKLQAQHLNKSTERQREESPPRRGPPPSKVPQRGGRKG